MTEELVDMRIHGDVKREVSVTQWLKNTIMKKFLILLFMIAGCTSPEA